MPLNGRVALADRRRLRVGVNDAGHRLVVRLPRLAEDVGGDDLALVLADVGQHPQAGDVADGPQPLAGPQLRVDRDVPARPAVTPTVSRPIRHAAGVARSRPGAGHRAARGRRRASARSPHRRAARRSPARRAQVRRRRGAAPHRAPRPAAPARGDSTWLGALDDRHLAAEAAHGLRHLDADGPAAEHQQRARARPSCRSPPGWSTRRRGRARPGIGRHDRIRAGGHHDVLGGVAARRRPRPRPARRAGRCRAAGRYPRSASQRCCPASE